jgi:ABC-type cobalamin/Fe3+-siderophores transport system ATPase subunit
MRPKAFQVTNYKTVLDSGRIDIDTNIACLMGKNEAGKSALMQALWKFNNVSNAKYDRLHDLPAELFSRLRGTVEPGLSMRLTVPRVGREQLDRL